MRLCLRAWCACCLVALNWCCTDAVCGFVWQVLLFFLSSARFIVGPALEAVSFFGILEQNTDQVGASLSASALPARL